MNLKEGIKKILEEYPGQMVSRGFDTVYNDNEGIDDIVKLIVNIINNRLLMEVLK